MLGLGAIDDMKLNTETDPADESKQYLLNYLPTIKQNTYTLGVVYKHYAGNHTQTVVLSRSYMSNSNVKYRDNDESTDENLTLRLKSVETENHLRLENRSLLGPFDVTAGLNADYAVYTNRTFQRAFAEKPREIRYSTDLGLFRWGLFATAGYKSANERFTASLGFRLDACDYSSSMSNPLNQFSPRLALSYNVAGNIYLNGSIGRYYQLPAYTTMGYQEDDVLVNRSRLTSTSVPTRRSWDWSIISTGGPALRSRAFTRSIPTRRFRSPTASRWPARVPTTVFRATRRPPRPPGGGPMAWR